MLGKTTDVGSVPERDRRSPVPELYADDVARRRTLRLMTVRALACRCPRCGARKVFKHWVRMAERCPGCGYRFEREEGFWFGAYNINLCVTLALLFFVFIWLIARQDGNAGASIIPPLVVGLFVCIVFPVVFYPASKTIWAAIDLATNPLELREIIAALDAVEPIAPVPDWDPPTPESRQDR
jgi:uncharacterized protein (DUF983 family)